MDFLMHTLHLKQLFRYMKASNMILDSVTILHFQQQLSIKLVIDEMNVGEESKDFGTFTVVL